MKFKKGNNNQAGCFCYCNGKTWTPAHDTFKVHTKVPTWFSPEEYVGPDDK